MRDFRYQDGVVTYGVSGHGRDVLLVHGLGSDRAQVESAFAGLAGRRVICPDMPGHGGSLPTTWSFPTFAALVLDVLDYLGVETADLGGISMGAGVALTVALAAPHRVRSLLLVRPAWLDGPALPHLRLIERIGCLLADEGVAAAGAWLDADGEMRRIEQSNPAAAKSIRSVLTRPQALEGASVLPAMVRDRPVADLRDFKAVRCPTLVAGNDDDPLHPAHLAQTLASHVPGASYIHLPSRYLSGDAHAKALTRSASQFLNGTA